MHGDVCLAAKVGVGARVWVSPLSPRSRSGQERRLGEGGGGAPGVGALRADAGSVGGGGRKAVLVAREPQCVTVRLRRQWVCAPGSAGAGNPQAVSAPRVRAPAPSPRTAGWPACLSGPSSRPASLSVRPLAGACRFPRARRSREAAPGVPGALRLSLSATPGHGFGRRLWPLSSLGAATPGRIRALPIPTFILGVCRAGPGGHR